jgi:hypothetical protein
MARSTKDKIDDLRKKEAQIKDQIQALKQREREAERKRDTRRKILIGGAVLAKIKRGDWPHQQLIDLVDSELKSDRDRELFDLPVSSSSEATGGNQS